MKKQLKLHKFVLLIWLLIAMSVGHFVSVWFALIPLAVSMIIGYKYRCPYCDESLDFRASVKDFCPNCGKKFK